MRLDEAAVFTLDQRICDIPRPANATNDTRIPGPAPTIQPSGFLCYFTVTGCADRRRNARRESTATSKGWSSSPADIGEYRPTGRCWPGCRCRTRAPPWPVWPVQSGFLPAAGVELELEVLDGTRGGEDVAVPEDLFETFQALADLAGEVASRRAAVHHCRVVRAGPWPWCSSRSGGLGRRRAPNRVPSTIVC